MPNKENIKDHQFKEGQSGNRKGRPAEKSIKSVLSKYLEMDVPLNSPLRSTFTSMFPWITEEKDLTYFDLINLRLVFEMNSGNIPEQAFNAIADRMEGKPRQLLSIQEDHEDERCVIVVRPRFAGGSLRLTREEHERYTEDPEKFLSEYDENDQEY